ncbi:MAG: phosphoribosyltransferase family protein [Paludibacter sp.]|nr:phosphoribosyltransferase family protein [Paludibacter sp.]
MNFKSILSDFIGLFYPDVCIICGNTLNSSEQHLCLECLNRMPRTGYHKIKNNLLEKRFWGKADIFRGTALFHFQKGSPFQKMLHELKYKGNQELGEYLGRLAAVEIITVPDFQNIDFIVPIPLHPNKYAKRGYNQSECIAKGISAILNKPVESTNLIRVVETATQTRKNVFERYENVSEIFKINEIKLFQNKHLLVVDDVLTTGSTIESAVSTLKKCEQVKISVLTLAIA